MRATIAPLILCHTLKMAPGMAASGKAAKCNVASDDASPLFCIPTSMDIAALLGRESPKRVPPRNPAKRPKMLCSATTKTISQPPLSSFSDVCDTIMATTTAIISDEKAGK